MSLNANVNVKANLIWAIADKLTGFINLMNMEKLFFH